MNVGGIVVKMKEISKVRVMTRGFVIDMIAGIKNMLGMRLNQYEELLNKGKTELWAELKEEGIVLKWYRYEITQLTNGALVILLYGEAK